MPIYEYQCQKCGKKFEILQSILKYPHPVLLRQADAVDVIDKEIRQTLQRMVATMDTNYGIGLAAPQVGIPLRLIVVRLKERLFQLVNPVISWESGQEPGIEGCLSLPDEMWEVPRAREVVVEALGLTGEQKSVLAAGLLARVFQHEIDHLNGILINSRGTKLKTDDKARAIS